MFTSDLRSCVSGCTSAKSSHRYKQRINSLVHLCIINISYFYAKTFLKALHCPGEAKTSFCRVIGLAHGETNLAALSIARLFMEDLLTTPHGSEGTWLLKSKTQQLD